MLNLPIYFTLLEVIRMYFDGKQDLYISQMMPAIFSTCMAVFRFALSIEVNLYFSSTSHNFTNECHFTANQQNQNKYILRCFEKSFCWLGKKKEMH